VQDRCRIDGLILAKIDYVASLRNVKWGSLEVGQRRVCHSGWIVNVNHDPGKSDDDFGLDIHHFLPLAALRSLKFLVRVWRISRKEIKGDSLFRFCAGVDALRLCQASTAFKRLCKEEISFFGLQVRELWKHRGMSRNRALVSVPAVVRPRQKTSKTSVVADHEHTATYMLAPGLPGPSTCQIRKVTLWSYDRESKSCNHGRLQLLR